MKKILLLCFTLITLFGYDVKEFVTCKDVQNLTPVEITDKFTTADKKVYAFAYFTNIEENSLIDFIWEKEVNGIWKLYADIQLPIFAGVRWRTYSNITIRPFFTGKWRVSIVEGNDTIDTKEFYITEANETK
ncbi:hypothetical protein NAMH_0690 [Nautilia profundicola AmH]|uniref:DUF2914 domain-containing protein n=1 Tax=Nautilia profundicola (strain ATCC BAA-1463 / DSM 18972 / AmH) TaxID=598659 RepID=B9L8Z3_NAUPA|nr:DUF2914 domain-containing protein [Nautilia profundicola]ACM92224.1 hypothetical protein NAMH_0690 [Nautilia profundicola AmH]